MLWNILKELDVLIPRRVVHVTGTIKHAQLAAIEHNRVVARHYRALANAPPAYKDSYEVHLGTSTNEIESLRDLNSRKQGYEPE
ncbi:hypothetical protein K435DRAFT_787467 [Dendrothele bispora CBS 962.96]|uniref:Uncharacterized protein n=1 Tax=Dendrothele bispora (strain CBS 962.96) TaxID=1314807 RepID=A0A4S8KKD6_DENBC|nr:hypothetical protein K435DRAFT_787467 [Dendrothele bispora CBS 962.96]